MELAQLQRDKSALSMDPHPYFNFMCIESAYLEQIRYSAPFLAPHS